MDLLTKMVIGYCIGIFMVMLIKSLYMLLDPEFALKAILKDKRQMANKAEDRLRDLLSRQDRSLERIAAVLAVGLSGFALYALITLL